MTKLTVKFQTEKCINALKCTNIAPSYFKIKGDTVELVGGKLHGTDLVRTLDCPDEVATQIVSAAKNCPANVITIIDTKTGKTLVDTEIKVKESMREITAQYDDNKEFVLDEKGYFLIRILPKEKIIEVGFCGKRNTVEVKITGKKPIDIYQTILREKIIMRPDHAAYLGRELQKAYIAIEQGLTYVQDDELVFDKKK